MQRPFLPSDLARVDQLQPWRRSIVAHAIGAISHDLPDAVITRLWGHDPRAMEAVQKAAVSPASTTGWGSALVGSAVGHFLKSLRPRSAAAQLFTAPLGMEGRSVVTLPLATTDFPEPVFIVEGGPIPAVMGVFGSVDLGPPRKLAMLTGITGDLTRYSAEDAELVITELMDDAAARSLDKAVFGTAAASSARPAGLLNGVSAITATTGGGVAAMVADIKALVGAISAAGGGASIMIFANPVQAVTLNLLAANGVGYPVIIAPSLTVGTIVAIEANAIASGFNGLPRVDTSTDAVIHYEDGTPLQIGTAGSPATVAAPTRSAFQSDMLILRLILPCAWVSRSPGAVQFITGATW